MMVDKILYAFTNYLCSHSAASYLKYVCSSMLIAFMHALLITSHMLAKFIVMSECKNL